MKTIYVYLSIGFPTATHEDELEIEDDVTEKEIDELVQDWANNYIETGWSTEKPKRRFR